MADYTKELHDPATGDSSPLDDGTTSSGILLGREDYETNSNGAEVRSLASSHSGDDDNKNIKGHRTEKVEVALSGSNKSTATTTTTTTRSSSNKISGTTTSSSSTELSTHVVDLNQTMPWKLFYPLISRETILSLAKATAINFFLPFVNGVFLGFGEICAHELAFRWGWTNSAHVVNVPGRNTTRPGVTAGDVGLRSAGSSGYSGSRSGIGGLGQYEEDSFSGTKTY